MEKASFCLGLLLLVAAIGTMEAAGSDFPMRDRICCDDEHGVAFRYPYEYQIPNQYHPGLVKPGEGGAVTRIEVEPGMSEEEVREAFMKAREKTSDFGVELFAVTPEELPSEAEGKDLAGIAKALTGHGDLAFETYDYYGDVANRPHGDPDWAPTGIEAIRGENASHCAMAIAHEGGHAVLLCSGSLDDEANARILDSFEVLKQRGRKSYTWRHYQCVNRHVIDAEGQALDVNRVDATKVAWKRAWEMETEHYHVTSNVSAAQCQLYAAQMEGLYDAFAGIYDPDVMPPFKMEIHVQKNQRDFAYAAAANGFGGVPPTALGFFSPTHLSIFAYETYEKGGGRALFSTLAHEASHQFLHVTCNGSRHVPTWINEGLAVYFESGRFQGGKFRWYPPKERIGYLTRVYSNREWEATLQPLDQYLDHYGHIPGMAYAEVYAITHFWIFGSRKGKKLFKKYWLALKEGRNGTEAFEEIFMSQMIEAKGSRDAAIEVWKKAVLQHVKSKRVMKAR